jgi:WD40 repeat protein
MALSAAGDQLVCADDAGKVRVWKRAKGTWNVLREFPLGDAPYCVAFSRHGELAAYLNANTLDVWDIPAGTKLRSLPTESDWLLRNAVFDLASRKLVASYLDTRAARVGWRLWNFDTGERLHDENLPTLGGTYPNSIDWIQPDNQLAIGFDEALLTYDMSDFRRTDVSGIDATIAVAFSRNDPYLAALNLRGWITVWNRATKRQIASLRHTPPVISRNSLSFSADGRRLASSLESSIQIWDLREADEKTVIAGHQGGIPCAAFHPTEQLLATGGKDDLLRFWNPMTGQLTGAVNLGEEVQTLTFSADGRLLAVGCTGRDGALQLRLIDVESRKVIYESDPKLGKVYSLTWAETPSEKFLAGSGERGIALWRVHLAPAVRLEKVYSADGEWCQATALDRKARLMVSVYDQRHLKARDVIGGRDIPLHAPEMLQGWHGLTFLPDGRSILYVAKTGIAEVWDVEADRRVDSLGKPGTFGAPHIALSSDGKWLAALTQPDTVSVWHRPTGEHVFSLRPETGSVWSLAWDPTAQHLAVGQSDGGLAVWHLPRIQKKLAGSGLQWEDDR